MKKILLLLCICLSVQTFAQEKKKSKFGSNIFLPSLEIGYIDNNSELLTGGILMKTSLEYRWRNNNDFFFRLNYDNNDADYSITQTGISNVLESKARFSDLLGGLGYRFGERDFRLFLLAQGGWKFYNFPVLEQVNNTFTLKESSQTITMTRFTLGLEYYFDEKSAFTFEVIQSSVLDKVDFWADKTGSWGFAVGFITSLF